MNILLDSALGRPGACPIYDEPGTCPQCGRPMKALHMYSADTMQTSMGPTSTYRAGRTQTTTRITTHYYNIRPCALGFCEACSRAEQDRLQAEKGQNPPNPAVWIIGAVLAAAGLAIIVRSMILNEHEVNALLGFGFAAFVLGLILFLRRISRYSRDRKEYLRCRSGARDYFSMDEGLASLMLSDKHPGKAWLTEKQLKEMQAKNDPLGLRF